jgi:uncharacterized glyoxalase superfamily protein PhnB
MSATKLSATLSQGITVADIQRSLKFYVDGLGFTAGDGHEVNGVLEYVPLKAGNANIGLGRDDFAKGRDRVKGTGTRLWLTTTQDLRALAAQVKAAGFPLDTEVEPLPWGPLGFAVTDPDGFKLTISNEG